MRRGRFPKTGDSRYLRMEEGVMCAKRMARASLAMLAIDPYIFVGNGLMLIAAATSAAIRAPRSSFHRTASATMKGRLAPKLVRSTGPSDDSASTMRRCTPAGMALHDSTKTLAPAAVYKTRQA